MPNQNQRSFIALNLPTEIKEDISKLVENFRQKSKGVKWVDPEALHLTLKFLGDTDPEQQQKIIEELKMAGSSCGELRFILGEINAFPGPSRPRVVFLECRPTQDRAIFHLQKQISDKMAALGFVPEKREWKPHITLGRVKSSDNKLPPFNKIKYRSREFSVTSFELISSALTRQGPRYSTIKRFPL